MIIMSQLYKIIVLHLHSIHLQREMSKIQKSIFSIHHILPKAYALSEAYFCSSRKFKSNTVTACRLCSNWRENLVANEDLAAFRICLASLRWKSCTSYRRTSVPYSSTLWKFHFKFVHLVYKSNSHISIRRWKRGKLLWEYTSDVFKILHYCWLGDWSFRCKNPLYCSTGSRRLQQSSMSFNS